MIRPKKLWLEGFGSIFERTKFKLNRPGLNVIIGENGVGKTTFVSSGLSWVLFGITTKSKTVATWPFRRQPSFVGTYGEITWEDDETGNKYRVVRTLDYKGKDGPKGSKLILYINEVPSDIRDKKPLQAEINRLLGYSHGLFMNTVLFGQKLKRLIDDTGPNKKKVFEEAFEAHFISEGKARADADLKSKKAEFAEIDKQYNKYQDQKELISSKIEFIQGEKAKFEKDKKEWVKGHKVQINRLKAKIKEGISRVKDEKDIRAKLKKAQDKISSIDGKKIQSAEDAVFRQEQLILTYGSNEERLRLAIKASAIEFNDLKKSCPTCGKKMDKSKIREARQKIITQNNKLKADAGDWAKKIVKEEKVLEGLKEELASLLSIKKQLSEYQKKVKHYEAVIKLNQATYNDIQIHTQRLKDVKNNLKKEMAREFKDESPKLIKELKALKKTGKELKAHYKTLKKEIDTLTWVSNEALGNKGLKAYVFETMLNGLNENLRYYEQYIGFRPEFRVDLESANKDIYALVYIGEDFVEYDDLSGGQQQTVNICTAFSLYDLVAGDKPISLMVFDEIFDGLTEKNTDLVYELVREKSEGKSVYMITHNIQLQNSSDKVIRVTADAQHRTILKML